VRQLNDEPDTVHIKWHLLERKERLQLEQCSGAWKLLAYCSGEGWSFYGRYNSGLGGFFSLDMDLQAFSSELLWFATYGGGETILRTLWQGYQTLYLFFRMQKCSLQLPLRVQECRSATFLRMQESQCCPWGNGKLTHLS
jgi:hypothetical protein